MFNLEIDVIRQGYQQIIGIDEAGRGPLAGPVVACAVLLKSFAFQSRIDDSKKLSPRQRLEAFHEIFNKAYVGIGMMNEKVIDEVNILEATFLAMNGALRDLKRKLPAPVLTDKTILMIDGPYFKTDFKLPYQTIIDGDKKCFSIACASIVAKVTRDRILAIYDQVFPQYGFKKHKGYPTKEHREKIKLCGPSLIHRITFQMA